MISVKELTKTYGKENNQVKALDGVSLEIAEGEMVAIIGTSGSGKSTLLHLLGGIDTPSNGSVLIDGKDIYQMKERERENYLRENVSIVFQFFNLIPILNVKENIELPLLLSGRKDDGLIDTLLEELQLEERRNHLPSELSGGQQQRVAIARAVVMKSKIILADEPTGNLDCENGNRVIELMKEVSKKYKKTIVIVTHDEKVAEKCNRTIKIDYGRITNG